MSTQDLTVYDLTPGRVVDDRFEVVGSHRQGGLSAAFEVLDVTSRQRGEMQLFPSALFEGPAQIEEFASSWEPWMRVQASSVLTVREILRLGDATLILLTDFPEGVSLRSALNERQRLTEDEVRRVGLQLLDGLVEVHAHGLIHGDIKPYTIHLEGAGEEIQSVMVDGGITPGLWTAKDLGEKTALIGTPYYAPVEQFGGESPDVQSDIYNVATVLFECACGVLPWPGKSFLEVFQAKLDKQPPSMGLRARGVEVDSGLEEVIVGGCLADRKERYPTAKEFRDRLAALG